MNPAEPHVRVKPAKHLYGLWPMLLCVTTRLLFLRIPRDAVRENKESRCPQANEDSKEFAMSANLKVCLLPSGKIPNGYGGENRSQT